jgi:dihydroorotate dehydrogenase electron transfer subunit
MTLKVPSIVEKSVPGQFVNIYLNDSSKLLPRPISICEIDKTTGILTLVYAVFGEGTRIISGYKAGESMDILGPLGNGYTIEPNKKHLLVGGGVGTPPLVQTAKSLAAMGEKDITVVVGFKSATYLVEEIESVAKVYVATDDGSFGHHGTVIDVLNKEALEADMIYACGPKPMMKALQTWVLAHKIPAQLSLEERMGCGFGACVGCSVKVTADNEAGYTYKKACIDGPVFDAKEVIL